ncbi:putative acetyl-coenzyme A synthetase 2-like, mitochondrial [Apostichopus japonicus]|uniref:acetate--CoA ligase n=1 Tax=Stichopus japonicus TaxID=307972 RepID=A0A2G8KNN8_STIJA|nr:putative acetyl-coenzyme A synthetase 2-like, mitochondrial [Apostichopus japonicus]
MDANDHLFMLYTSGSTGSPKGLIHAQAGYLLHAMMAHKFVFDYCPGDIYACVADVGWITGHSFVVYGPLCNGATSILFESVPTYPDPGRYWEMVERLKVNQIYLVPTALRLLLKSGDTFVKKYDRSSLRTLGCVGEPLNHEAWEWYHDVIGDKRLILWILGGKQKQEIQGNNVSGALCIKQPWPGLARTIYGNHERFVATYLKDFPGVYRTGDGAHRDVDGYYHITGRMDDVINVTGHRLGTAEVEDAMDEHGAVAETAVVGFPHDIKGEGVYAYVILKDGITDPEDQIIAELKAMTKKKIAGYAVPEVVLITPGLPKTHSGKNMRRILRKICAGEKESLGDTSTLADPSIVETLIEKHEQLTSKQ